MPVTPASPAARALEPVAGSSASVLFAIGLLGASLLAGGVLPLATSYAISEAFGTWVQKSMYGRKYMGMERSTFLIDPAGRVVKAWRKIKVPGHAEATLEAVRALESA